MSDVAVQYEAFPYPERDPADEKKRLVRGSPSVPHEIDHFVFAGQRDWRKPIRVLVAGGGTGDGLIQLAQLLSWAKMPYDILYLDMSEAAREIAQERATIRGLRGIRFETGSLLDAPQNGLFDYIDCCGVLHHLPDPAAGFSALREALAPGGGLGFMVYAPFGRSGVYPLQAAFGAVLEGLSPKERLTQARAILDGLPQDHPFKKNALLSDHNQSDAGFYDLLLHSQDRPFAVHELLDMLDGTGWRLSGFCQPALYDLSLLAPVPPGMDKRAQMAAAEQLRGTLKVHVGYAVAQDHQGSLAQASDRTLIPHLKGGQARQLAKIVTSGKPVPITIERTKTHVRLPRETAPLLARITGRHNLQQIAQGAGMDPIRFGGLWSSVEKQLCGWGLMHYSSLRM